MTTIIHDVEQLERTQHAAADAALHDLAVRLDRGDPLAPTAVAAELRAIGRTAAELRDALTLAGRRSGWRATMQAGGEAVADQLSKHLAKVDAAAKKIAELVAQHQQSVVETSAESNRLQSVLFAADEARKNLLQHLPRHLATRRDALDARRRDLAGEKVQLELVQRRGGNPRDAAALAAIDAELDQLRQQQQQLDAEAMEA